MLNRIDGPTTAVKSKEQGELNENDLPAPRELRVKEDAKVMFIKNDPEGRWVNGTIGVVIDCSDKNKKVIKIITSNSLITIDKEANLLTKKNKTLPNLNFKEKNTN